MTGRFSDQDKATFLWSVHLSARERRRCSYARRPYRQYVPVPQRLVCCGFVVGMLLLLSLLLDDGNNQ